MVLTNSATLWYLPTAPRYGTYQQRHAMVLTNSATLWYLLTVPRYGTYQQCHAMVLTNSATLWYLPTVPRYGTYQQCHAMVFTNWTTNFSTLVTAAFMYMGDIWDNIQYSETRMFHVIFSVSNSSTWNIFGATDTEQRKSHPALVNDDVSLICL